MVWRRPSRRTAPPHRRSRNGRCARSSGPVTTRRGRCGPPPSCAAVVRLPRRSCSVPSTPRRGAGRVPAPRWWPHRRNSLLSTTTDLARDRRCRGHLRLRTVAAGRRRGVRRRRHRRCQWSPSTVPAASTSTPGRSPGPRCAAALYRHLRGTQAGTHWPTAAAHRTRRPRPRPPYTDLLGFDAAEIRPAGRFRVPGMTSTPRAWSASWPVRRPAGRGRPVHQRRGGDLGDGALRRTSGRCFFFITLPFPLHITKFKATTSCNTFYINFHLSYYHLLLLTAPALIFKYVK